MKTSSVVKWGAVTAVVLGMGAVAIGSANAAEDDPGSGEGFDDSGVRHGIRYDGCNHFDLDDPAAIEEWGRSNAWRFAKWLPKLEELKTNPEPAIVEALELLFPECPWPPPSETTFGPGRVPWSDAMAAATETLQTLDLGAGWRSGDSMNVVGTMLGKLLGLTLRGQPLRRRRRG